MDFGALPPEINSGLMYAGPGSGSMLAASTAWDGLASELGFAASSYQSVISGLTGGPWQGPAATAMADAVAPYITWMAATARQAEQVAAQARAAAGAYHVAFAMTVPPAVIAANRAQLMALIATNFFGQNTPAIMVTEAQYVEMWAQDATAMYGYAGNSAAASTFTPFTSPPQTADPAGVGSQTAAVAQATGTSAGTAQTSLSQLTTTLSNALQSLVSPASSTASGSGVSGVLNALLTGPSAAAASGGGFGGLGGGSLLQSTLGEYLYLPGFFGMFAAMDALSPVMSQLEAFPPAAAAAEGAEGAADAAAGEAAGAEGAWGAGSAGDAAAWGSLGEAESLGPLSVPPNWLWSAAAPLETVVPPGVPFVLPEAGIGAASGWPMVLGGLPRAAATGAAAGAGAAAVKYGSRPRVMARPPAAGYPEEAKPPATPRDPAASGHPPNGHAPPGYRPAIVYVPTNGHAPANV